MPWRKPPTRSSLSPPEAARAWPRAKARRAQPAEGDLAPLAHEPWMDYPEKERVLWERARPRALRREAAQLKALKLPTANLNRLMRLNPDMPFRSAEAADSINYATVLVLQALARAAVRGRSSQRITFADIKRACVGMRELQCLQPLDATLDATATMLRAADLPPPVVFAPPEEEVATDGKRTVAPAAKVRPPPPAKPLKPGQKM